LKIRIINSWALAILLAKKHRSDTNKMGEINWLITLLVGALLSIPIGIIANLLSRPFEGWLSKQALMSKGKSVARLKKDYERIKNYHENPLYFQLIVNQRSVRSSVAQLSFILTVFLVVVIYLLNSNKAFFGPIELPIAFFSTLLTIPISIMAFLTMLLTALNQNSMNNLADDISRVIKFDEYEKTTLARIESLESLIKK
jgi:hypothetical protein